MARASGNASLHTHLMSKNTVDMAIFGDRPLSGVRRGEAFTVEPARYSVGKVVVAVKKVDGGGFKGAGARLAEALGGKWAGRDHGYQLAPQRAVDWCDLHAAGADARYRFFEADESKDIFELRDNKNLTLSQARALLRAKREDPLPDFGIE